MASHPLRRRVLHRAWQHLLLRPRLPCNSIGRVEGSNYVEVYNVLVSSEPALLTLGALARARPTAARPVTLQHGSPNRQAAAKTTATNNVAFKAIVMAPSGARNPAPASRLPTPLGAGSLLK